MIIIIKETMNKIMEVNDDDIKNVDNIDREN